MREVRLSMLAFHNFTGFRVTSRKSYVNEADGVLGIGFLHYFTVGLDFAHGRVYLTPNADGRTAMGLK